MALGQFSPGPDMLLLTRHSLQAGCKAGIFTACGIATGLALHSSIALTGSAWLFSPQQPWYLASKIAASLYLLYLAYQILRSSTEEATEENPVSHGRYYLRGLLCNVLNPKVALILASISAPFLGASPTPQRAILLGSIIVIQGLALWILWAKLLQWHKLQQLYQRQQKNISNTFAVLLIVLVGFLWLG